MDAPRGKLERIAFNLKDLQTLDPAPRPCHNTQRPENMAFPALFFR